MTMTDSHWGKDLEVIQEEINTLKQQVSRLMEKEGKEPPAVGRICKTDLKQETPYIRSLLEQLETACGKEGGSGGITYMGIFSSSGRQSVWAREGVETDTLLALGESSLTGKVLSCIGSQERIHLLFALLRKPMTVAQLVEECGYHSTGQVYHYLKPLLAADLVTEASEEGRGCYVVRPYRVQGLLMLMAGISDLVDATYTQGIWENADQNVPK